jgi:transcriptional regulator with XRE-family HTH domain
MAFWDRKRENKYNEFIRRQIRLAREDKGMSQEDLAKAIHRSRITITNLESGRTEVNAVDLMGIAYVLEKPIRYFFPVYVPTEDDLSSNESELIHYFRMLEGNEAMQDLVLESAKRAAEIATQADVKAMKREIERERTKAKGKR